MTGLQSSLNTYFNSDMQDTIMEMRAVAPNTLFRQRGIGGTALDPLPGCKQPQKERRSVAAAI